MQGSEATMSLRGDTSGISQGACDGHADAEIEMQEHAAHRRSSNTSRPRQSGSGFDFANAGAEDAAEETKRLLRVVAASMVGNILEWYDFGAFAYFANEIGQKFFPKSDSSSSVLNAFVVFGGAFFIRPLGGLLFGHMGDKSGRKKALYVSVALMAGSTFAMGCLPTYETAGIYATVMLVILRCLQGLSVGGELVGSMIYAVESSPPQRQVMMGSLCLTGAIMGLTLGSLVGLIIHSLFSEEDVLEWGWRIPFLSGVLIGAFAVWIRNGLDESAEYEQSQSSSNRGNAADNALSLEEESAVESSASSGAAVKPALEGTPLWTSVREHPIEIMTMFMVSGTFAVGVWVLTAFPPTLYQDLMDPPLGWKDPAGDGEGRGGRRSGGGGAMFERGTSYIWLMHTGLCCVQIASIAFFGWLGDHVGNTRMMVLSVALISIGAVPCLAAMGEGSITSAVLGQGTMNILLGVAGGNLPTWMVKSFPVDVRYSAIAIGYNSAQALFGGTAGVLATLIYSQTRSTALIGFYHSGLAALSFVCIVMFERRRRRAEEPFEWTFSGVYRGLWKNWGGDGTEVLMNSRTSACDVSSQPSHGSSSRSGRRQEVAGREFEMAVVKGADP